MPEPKKVIAIDPGYDRIGIAVVEKDTKEELVFSECFQTSKDLPFHDRLFSVAEEVSRVIKKYKPDALAMENVFMANNQKTAMHVAEIRGMLMYMAGAHDLDLSEFTPLQIKTAVAGHGKASKADIEHMMPHLISVDLTDMIDDEIDAIAVGLTYFAYSKNVFPQ